MPVIIRTKSGAEFMLDRRYSTVEIRKRVDDGRKDRFGVMLQLDDNRTPSRSMYVDPHEVEVIWHDGHNY